MNDGHKILVVAEELIRMVEDAYTDHRSGSNRDQLIGQALNGICVSMTNVLTQTKQLVEIENGNS